MCGSPHGGVTPINRADRWGPQRRRSYRQTRAPSSRHVDQRGIILPRLGLPALIRRLRTGPRRHRLEPRGQTLRGRQRHYRTIQTIYGRGRPHMLLQLAQRLGSGGVLILEPVALARRSGQVRMIREASRQNRRAAGRARGHHRGERPVQQPGRIRARTRMGMPRPETGIPEDAKMGMPRPDTSQRRTRGDGNAPGPTGNVRLQTRRRTAPRNATRH